MVSSQSYVLCSQWPIRNIVHTMNASPSPLKAIMKQTIRWHCAGSKRNLDWKQWKTHRKFGIHVRRLEVVSIFFRIIDIVSICTPFIESVLSLCCFRIVCTTICQMSSSSIRIAQIVVYGERDYSTVLSLACLFHLFVCAHIWTIRIAIPWSEIQKNERCKKIPKQIFAGLWVMTSHKISDKKKPSINA